jgi:hypothetical protein
VAGGAAGPGRPAAAGLLLHVDLPKRDQKLPPTNAAIDVPLALVIVGLGILIVLTPWSVPGLLPAM